MNAYIIRAMSPRSLVVLTLGLYGTVTVRNRRMELSADSARRLSSIGGLARVAVESTIKDGLYEDLGPLMAARRRRSAGPTRPARFSLASDACPDSSCCACARRAPGGHAWVATHGN